MESSIVNPLQQKRSCYVNMLFFNVEFGSLGVCVCVCVYTLFMGVYTAWLCDRMGFDDFLTPSAVHAFELMYLCVWECM